MRSTLAALGIAALGASAATAIGMPAGVLIGATVAVAAAAAAGLPVGIPNRLRDVAFAMLGIVLGAGATPNLFADVSRWPLSLAVLPFALATMMMVALLLLRATAGLRGPPALLATSPGALSFALALAEERKVDAGPVVSLQSLRLVMITVLLPPLVALLDRDVGSGGTDHVAVDAGSIGLLGSVVLLGCALALGWLLARLRVPAAWLFGGLFVSLPAHVTGLVEGRPDTLLTMAAFVVVGALVGTRFGAIRFRSVARLLGAGTLTTVAATATAAVLAWPVARSLDVPFGQVWIAYAPGGVEAMAAIALALDYDPLFVTAHHVARLLVLAVTLPLLTRMSEGTSSPRSRIRRWRR